MLKFCSKKQVKSPPVSCTVVVSACEALITVVSAHIMEAAFEVAIQQKCLHRSET